MYIHKDLGEVLWEESGVQDADPVYEHYIT